MVGVVLLSWACLLGSAAATVSGGPLPSLGVGGATAWVGGAIPSGLMAGEFSSTDIAKIIIVIHKLESSQLGIKL